MPRGVPNISDGTPAKIKKRRAKRKTYRSAKSAMHGNIKRANVGRGRTAGRTAGNTDRNLILLCMANLSSLLPHRF